MPLGWKTVREAVIVIKTFNQLMSLIC